MWYVYSRSVPIFCASDIGAVGQGEDRHYPMGDGEATLITREGHEEGIDLYRAVCILYTYPARACPHF